MLPVRGPQAECMEVYMSKSLPERPNLEQLKNVAKDLLKAARAGESEAVRSLTEVGSPPFALAQAQLAVAREYGFESWPKLVRHLEEVRAREGITSEIVEQFLALAFDERTERFRRMLDLYPALASHDPACALATANVEFVRSWLTPERVSEPVHKNMRPLDCICYSRISRAVPEAMERQADCARLLLDAGADPNGQLEFEHWNLPVLYGASCEARHLGLTRLLLERGAKPNDGESIYHAAQHDLEDILETLVEFGADISMRDPGWGNTPLYFLSGYRPTDPGTDVALRGIRWLLEHGADPNVPCQSNGEYPLHTLCMRGWGREMLEMFLKHGADPNLKREDGRTAYALACAVGNVEAVETLAEHGADTILTAEEQVAADLARGRASGPLPASDLRDRLFVRLAEIGNLHGVRAMLDSDVPPDVLDKDGATALHFAGFCGWPAVTRLLLERGAPLDVQDPEYHATPLGWALHATFNHRSPKGDYEGVLRAFLEHGGNREDVEACLQHEDVPAEIRKVLSDPA